MENESNYESIDELIDIQITKLNELKQVISVLCDQKFLTQEMSDISTLMNKIRNNLTILHKQKKQAEKNIDLMESCKNKTDNLNNKLNRIENFINAFNGFPQSSTMMESTLHPNFISTPHSSTARQLDFTSESFFNNSKPNNVQNSEMQYLTQSEFQNIPGYMLGRVTCDTLNSLIDKINECIARKYKLFCMPRSKVKKPGDIEKYINYKNQECPETKGLTFFTQDDLKDLLGGKIDKQTLNLLTMLRHTRRIREIRIGGILRYVRQ